MIQSTLQDILRLGDLPISLADRVSISGDDPVFNTPFRIAAPAAAAMGAVGIALAELRRMRTGVKSDISIDARVAGAAMGSAHYILVDGKPGRNPGKNVAGFYKVANGRINYFHCNVKKIQDALLRVLRVPADRAQVAEAAKSWDFLELEDAVDKEGGCAPAVRTFEEWNALENTAIVRRERLVEIKKIADGPPMPLPSSSKSSERPLSDLRALDLTRIIAGPTCNRLLAEYGADVLKISCEDFPDSASNETDTTYGKRAANLDLRTPVGRARMEELVRGADVFCQAYRQGAMDRLGLSQQRVAELRPGIIYVSLCAFGFTGPWKERRGFDTVLQAASGMVSHQGTVENPSMMPVTALDYLAGYLMAFGTLVALKRRAEVGGSYSVKVSLARCREWVISLGLFTKEQLKDVPAEPSEDELNKVMITVPSPLGRLRRFRPIIRFSHGAFSELVPWNEFKIPDPIWKS